MKKSQRSWKGYYKVQEEMGELGQILGKLVYQNDKATIEHLHEEIGDVLATLEYLVKHNNLDRTKIHKRFQMKLARHEKRKLPAMVPVS